MEFQQIQEFIEGKAQRLILQDARALQELRKFLREKDQKISRAAQDLWKRLATVVTKDTAQKALDQGAIPAEWETAWSRMIREFVRDDVSPQWNMGIATAGDQIAKKVNRLQRKQFDFDSTMTRVKAWVDNKGGKLIVDLTAGQMSSVRALLQNQIAMQVTSPYILAQRIRPIVGLTHREAMAVSKFMIALMGEGVSADLITKQVANYTKFLHKNRAQRIARTELSDAYNFGQIDAIRQAVDEEWLPGQPQKTWMAGGINPCEICLANEEAGAISVDSAFPSGDDTPTAHPQCECALGYEVMR